MTRTECERAMLEKLIEIRNIYKEYNPNGKYLSLAYRIGINGNDDGDWDTERLSILDGVYLDSTDANNQIYCDSQRDIKNEKYWACMSEEDDRESEEYNRENDMIISDGWWWIARKR